MRKKIRFLLGSIGVAALWVLLTASVRAEPTPAAAEKAKPEIEIIENVAYYEGPDADKFRHKLDLYLPKGRKEYPVVFFVHGGAWQFGDKNCFGYYSNFGKVCAQSGFGAVLTNYRLSPGVAHPEHIKDVARAFAWTHKNIGKYNGRADQLFVSGHSAGGHLAALLATDERYLKAEGLSLQSIKGAIPISGVYHVPEKNSLFTPIFGDEAKGRQDASPVAHAKPDLPPFLLLYADDDLPYCGKIYSEEFCNALKEKKCAVESLEIKPRTHVNIMRYAAASDDPVTRALHDFIGKHTKE